MKTTTLTPAQAGALTVAATEELLRGWVGPCEIHTTWLTGAPWIRAVSVYGRVDGGRGAPARLPLSRPEVRDRVVRVAAEGVSCLLCEQGDLPEIGGPTGARHYLDRPCSARPPTDLSPFRDSPNLRAEGWTSAELSAALLWLSWARMAAGMGPVRRLLDVERPHWVPAYREDGWRMRGLIVGDGPDREGVEPDMEFDARFRRHAALPAALLAADGTLTAEVPDE